MRGISHRTGGQDDYIYRCGCGSWLYRGQPCPTCIILLYQQRYITKEGNVL